MAFAQEKGAGSIYDISYDMIRSFHAANSSSGKAWDMLEENAVSAMFSYFYGENMVPYGFTVITHYLFFGRGCFWNDIGQDAYNKIRTAQISGTTIPVEEFHAYHARLRQLHVENGYSRSVLWAGDKVANLLILFLDMNGYGYTPETAEVWFEGVRKHLGADAVAMKRALCLLGQYHEGQGFNLEQVVGHRTSRYYTLPGWCREAGDCFMDSRRQEGLKNSSIDGYKAAVYSFCSYLIYLCENGHMDNPMLFMALTTAYAPEESVVTVLTAEEMSLLEENLAAEDSGLSLRDRAMLLLGLRMGVRAVDVVGLKYSDIDWKKQSIRFIQQKTGVEVTLPMPVDVGNAVYRYITEERREKSIPQVFLRMNAPYGPVGTWACIQALEKALPERNVAGSGFHVTRRTFATCLLRTGTGMNTVADALGHRGTGTVHRYLSLDDGRMRMCPLSLRDYGIGGWTYER